MSLSFSQTNQLLAQLGHEPRKQLGQNFLIDGNIVQKSLRMADLQPGERVVEVGPGLGTLTESMLEKGAQVYAVEYDRKLYEHLSTSLLPRFPEHLHLLHADAVDHPLAQLPIDSIERIASARTDQNEAAPELTQTGDFKIIANLPYAISTPWLETVLSGPLRPRRMVLMLQKEAAERFIAEPGNKTYGAISIFTASAYRSHAGHAVSRQCFFPIPGVDSILLSLEVLKAPQPWSPQARNFVRQFFIHRRKQIGSLVKRAAEEVIEQSQTRKLSAKARKAAALAAESVADTETTGSQPQHISPEQAQAIAERLHTWLAQLEQHGTSTDTRPESIPLEGWQALANAFLKN